MTKSSCVFVCFLFRSSDSFNGLTWRTQRVGSVEIGEQHPLSGHRVQVGSLSGHLAKHPQVSPTHLSSKGQPSRIDCEVTEPHSPTRLERHSSVIWCYFPCTSQTVRCKLLTSSMSMMIMFGGETSLGFPAIVKHIRHKKGKVWRSITPVAEQKSHELPIRKFGCSRAKRCKKNAVATAAFSFDCWSFFIWTG